MRKKETDAYSAEEWMIILNNCAEKEQTKLPLKLEVEHLSQARLRATFLEGLQAQNCEHLRQDIWKFLCRCRKARQQFNPELYAKFLQQNQPEIDTKIEKDIYRTCPDQPEFMEPAASGHNKLFNILKAYSQYDPETSYVQGMNYIGMLLLKYMQDEQDAFWCFVFVMQERGWREIFAKRSNRVG